jgi:hypothetical protein
MNIQAWPFLVSRNRYLGYQTVVAPGFMVDANISGLLANQLGSEPSDYPQYVELPKTKVGSLFAVYRVVRASEQGVVYRDESGRPILWIEGVVLQEPAKNITFTGDVLMEAHRRVESDYRQFWEQAKAGPVRRSQPFSVAIDPNQIAMIASTQPTVRSVRPDQSSISGASIGSTVHTESGTGRAIRRPRSWYVAVALSALFIASLLWGSFMFIQNRQLTSQIRDLQATVQAQQTTRTP